MEQISKKELHIIFQKLQNKDKQAFNELYENYYKLVERIAYSILKNKEESEDITQNVFAKIFEMQIENLPNTCEASWLYAVTKNEAITYLKKKKNDLNLESIYDISSEDQEINNVIELETYNKLVKGLKPTEKEIVSLRIISQMSFKQISYVLNMPIPTVQWHYYKAIKSLKTLISSLGLVVVAILLYGRNLLKMGEKKSSILENVNDNTVVNNQTDLQDKLDEGINKEENSYENLTQEKPLQNNTITENITQTENSTTIIQNQQQISVKQKNALLLTAASSFLILSILITIIFTKYQQKTYQKKS